MQSFDELFESSKRDILSISIRYHKVSGIPIAEFISQLNEELWLAYRDFNANKGAVLRTWLYGCLKKRAVDVLRFKEGNYHRRRGFLDSTASTDETDAPKFEVVANETVEDEVLKIKEADQRQLIDFLVNNDPSQVDPETRLIVSEFSQYPSITALAKALGLHHEVVKRKLRKLARNYDSSRFGDYRDYLVV